MTAPAPSPRPAPHGDGEPLPTLGYDHAASESTPSTATSTLSPRERAGVRGNASRFQGAHSAFAGLAIILIALIPFLTALTATAATKPLFGDARRVVFLGDSITYAGQYVEFIDAYATTRQPDVKVEIIDIGLPSETVSGLSEEGHAGGKFPRPDLHERLDRVLATAKPDLVIACYGMNCGIYLPFEESRFAKYREGIEKLRTKSKAAGARIIHVTPPTFDEKQGGHPGYSNTLDRYSEWLVGQRKQGWEVIDLHTPMNRYLAEQRVKDPAFFLAKDGVHCNETGHWIMAKTILQHLGAKDGADAADAKAMLAKVPKGTEVLKLIQQRQRVLKDAYLSAAGHKRPGMKTGLPIAEAEAKAKEIQEQLDALKAK